MLSKQPEPGAQDWQNAAVDWQFLHALVNKISQQMFTIGLDSTLLRFMADSNTLRSDQSISDSECNPFIEVSETEFTFEFYLSVDIDNNRRIETDSDIQKSKARKIYRTLVRRKQCPIMTEQRSDRTRSSESATETNSLAFQGNKCESLELLQQSSRDFIDWIREMETVKLSSARERSCEQCSLKTVEIPVRGGTIFFRTLAGHAFALHMLQHQQIHKTEERMARLNHSLARVTTPRRLSGKKSDLDVWRKVLKLFLDANILNTGADGTTGSNSQLTPVQRLMGLQNHIAKARLSANFRCEGSRPLLIELFEVLINNLQFQSFLAYQHQAVVQVLEKFENNTNVSVRLPFLQFLKLDYSSDGVRPFLNTVGSLFLSEIVSVVPQLEDYSCPVCTDIAFMPIRLACGHVFCIRCMVKLQRCKAVRCPICRQDTVMIADADNICGERQRFFKTFFPTEVKRKRRADEKELVDEQFSRATSTR
ncbi:hypothetical protein FGG08_003958 [Glutinoglossum americanum]|uniref:RING-type domain-containing protein n=1 Tax=Glutinoglossum americanum TaxID=1670608 RepID=A0A9P8IA19_9PEZI|nr:hypothetical protein FGG08_003958 [Glutinoglossum americanum]